MPIICKHDGCNTRPSFNYSSEKIGKYCLKHKLKNIPKMTTI